MMFMVVVRRFEIPLSKNIILQNIVRKAHLVHPQICNRHTNLQI